MRMRLDAARATLLAAVARPPDPDPVAHYGRMAGAKLFTCQTALEVCTMALRTAGGSGYLRTGPLERLLRDAHAGLLLPPPTTPPCSGWAGSSSARAGCPREGSRPDDRPTRPVPPARWVIDNEYYEGMDELWWDPNGPASILHAINRPRVDFYLKELGDLGGRLVLDAGCGGGLVARELAAAGAEVVGVDRSRGSLGVARRAVGARFRPAQGRLERLPFAGGSFDAVVAADVLEHLPDLPAAVAELARVLAPGGSFVFDTVNRTFWSWFTGVFGLEQVLRMVPGAPTTGGCSSARPSWTGCCAGPAWSRSSSAAWRPGSAPGRSPAACSPAASTCPPSSPATGAAPPTWGTTERRRDDRSDPGPRHRHAGPLRLQAVGDRRGVLRRPAGVGPGLGRGVRRLGGGPPGLGGGPVLVHPAAEHRRPDARVRPGRPQAGAEAARRALEQAGPAATGEVADLLAVTCTGYSGPGLDVHLVDDLGLGDRVQRLAVGHMGCYAALPALRTAAALATASGGRTLVTCVELCTLHVQPPRTREDAVYLALFGDGAAAALVGAGGDGPAIVGSATVTVPNSEERMGWMVEDDGFHMWLSPRVPALVERGVGRLVDDLLLPHGLAAEDVAHWAVHPGGPEIVDRVQRRLGLGDAQVARSREVLADGGNRSSATVLFILEQLLASGEVEPGQWIVALAFGTGLTLEALLLRA